MCYSTPADAKFACALSLQIICESNRPKVEFNYAAHLYYVTETQYL